MHVIELHQDDSDGDGRRRCDLDGSDFASSCSGAIRPEQLAVRLDFRLARGRSLESFA